MDYVNKRKKSEWEIFVLILVAGRLFSPGTLVSSTNKTDCHDTTEILLKVA
jgi:hypothetical protein